MPNRERSRNGLSTGPRRDGHHGYPSVFNLFEPELLHLIAVEPPIPLGEPERIEAKVPRDPPPLVVHPVVRHALEPPANREDLQPACHGDHLNRVEGGGSSNVREGNSGRGGEHPPGSVGGVEHVRAGWAQVQGEVDVVLLDQEADGGEHCGAAVLELRVLEPGQTCGVALFNENCAEGGALVGLGWVGLGWVGLGWGGVGWGGGVSVGGMGK